MEPSKTDMAASEPAVVVSVPPEETPAGRSPYRRRTLTVIGVIIALVVLWEISGFIFAYTDDAILTSDLVSVAPQVTGPIQSVRVHDNQVVQVGDVLFTIDPTPFQLAVDQASDAVARAQAQIALDQTSLGSAQALQASAQAQAQQAEADLGRATDLSGSGFEAAQGQEEAQTAARRTADMLAAAQDAVLRAQQTLRLDQIEIAAAHAALALAEWRLNHTRVVAPVAGHITHFTLLPGDTATADKPLVALVASNAWYVNANYKEGVIRHLKPGALGWVWLDSHPFHLYRARVQGVAGGIERSKTTPSGLLPYVDPTVDWIRLEARFPVRFELLDAPPESERLMGSDARSLVIY